MSEKPIDPTPESARNIPQPDAAPPSREASGDTLALLTALAGTTGPAFFDELISRVGALLQVDCALVGRFKSAPAGTAGIIAMWNRGRKMEEFTFDVPGSPFALLLESDTCEIAAGFSERFPEFKLPEMETIAACAGVALKAKENGVIGFLAVFHGAELEDTAGAMRLLRQHAARTADELARERVLERSKQSEERFKFLARATTDAVWDWDIVADTVWHSDAFSTLFKIQATDGEAPAAGIERIHAEDAERIQASLQAALEGDENFWQEEYRYRRGDGTYAMILDRSIIMRDASGNATRIIGGMTDITERIEAARRLREQAELLDRASDAIIVRDLEDKIQFWNRGAERLFGWTTEEAVDANATALFGMGRKDFDKAASAVMETGEWSGEVSRRDKSGGTHLVNSRWTLIRGPAGEPRAFLNIDTDITEKKQLEAQFLRAQRLESIGVLAGGIAHDLNNMLTPITMAVGILKRMHPEGDEASLLESIEASAHRGADLVRQVLGFARGVEGQKLTVSPAIIVRDIAKIARDTFAKNIRVHFESKPDCWQVQVDPTQLYQVLLNLSVNARDAMPEGGDLTISVTNAEIHERTPAIQGVIAPGNYSAITVTDTGTGIPPEICDKIFDPFFSTKGPGEGTGLGLSTVLAIIRTHGGFVTYTTAPQHGTSFRVLLPAEAETTRKTGSAATDALPGGNGELILVVDDEAHIRTIAKQTLESFNYTVLVAANGAEALALYLEHADRVGLVFIDMMMPVMDGPALIRALMRINPVVRMVAASGLNSEAMMERARAAGALHFIPKPYTAAILLQKINEILHPATPG